MPISTPTIAPTVAEFLADYTAFDTSANQDSDAVQFGEEAINYWLQNAVLMLNQARLGNMYYTACELFMAHNLSLEAWAQQGGDQTIPGLAKGAIAATASGDVSVSYNNQTTMELDAGHWNYTVYGQRFIKLVRLSVAGPLQVTGGCSGSGGAWAGPWVFNIPNPS